MKLLIYSIFFLLLSTIVYAGTIDPDVPEAKYIEYGKKHECVLPIVGIYNDKENNFFRASCVLIDEQYILTAAHVVANSAAQHIIYNNQLYTCKKVIIHKDFKMSEIGYYDIAIAELDKKIKLVTYPKLYSKKDEIGKICSIAGYGYGGNFSTGSVTKHDNLRRAGSNIIDEIEKHLLICSAHTKPKTELEFLTSSGDSGGGLFIDNKLAGISSIVIATDGKSDSNYGDFCGYTRVSEYVDWIESTKNSMEIDINEK
jgi:hypothetical protein